MFKQDHSVNKLKGFTPESGNLVWEPMVKVSAVGIEEGRAFVEDLREVLVGATSI